MNKTRMHPPMLRSGGGMLYNGTDGPDMHPDMRYTPSGPTNTHSLNLDRSNDEAFTLTDASGPDWDITTDCTVSGWGNPSGIGTGEQFTFVARYGNNGFRQYIFQLRESAGSVLYEILTTNGGSGVKHRISWDVTAFSSGWANYLCAHDESEPSASASELYVDGVSQGNGTVITAVSADIGTSTQTTHFGCRTNGNHAWNGLIDDIAAWSRILTAQEIADVVAGYPDRVTSSLVDLYRFDGETLAGVNYTPSELNGPLSYSTDLPF